VIYYVPIWQNDSNFEELEAFHYEIIYTA